MSPRTLIAMILFLAVFYAAPVSGQTPAADPPPDPFVEVFRSIARESESEANLPDLDVPQEPAFAILGVNPQSVIRPATARAFGVALLNGFDENGNFQTGFSADFSPYRVLTAERLTMDVYRDDPNGFSLDRFLARMQWSLATAKGTSDDDDAVRIAAGVRFTLFDFSDPRMDTVLDDCFAKAAAKFPELESADKVVERFEAYAKKLPSKFNDCRAERAKKLWNKSAMQIGFAPAWIDPKNETGQGRGLESRGYGIWSSLSWGFEQLPGSGLLGSSLRETGQLILHARHLSNDRVADEAMKDVFFTQDRTVLGMRFQAGKPDRSFSLEGSYDRVNPKAGRKTDTSYRMSAGVNLKLMDDLWLRLGVGGTGGRETKDNGFVSVAFKLGASKTDYEPFLKFAKTLLAPKVDGQ